MAYMYIAVGQTKLRFKMYRAIAGIDRFTTDNKKKLHNDKLGAVLIKTNKYLFVWLCDRPIEV